MSNFMKIRAVGPRVVPCGRTDGHEDKSLFIILRIRLKTDAVTEVGEA